MVIPDFKRLSTNGLNVRKGYCKICKRSRAHGDRVGKTFTYLPASTRIPPAYMLASYGKTCGQRNGKGGCHSSLLSYLLCQLLNSLRLSGKLCLPALGLRPSVAVHPVLSVQRTYWHGMMCLVSYIKRNVNGDTRKGWRGSGGAICNSDRFTFSSWKFPMDGER